MTKNYLRFLVEEIVVFDDRVVIKAKARNAIVMMAHPEPLAMGGANHPDPVLAKGGDGLPSGAACENGLAKVIVFLPERRKRCQDGELRLPKSWPTSPWPSASRGSWKLGRPGTGPTSLGASG